MMGPRETIYLEVAYRAAGVDGWARVGLVDAETSPRSGWRGMIAGEACEDPTERIRAAPFVGAYLIDLHTKSSPVFFRVTETSSVGEVAHVVPYYVDSIVVDEAVALAPGLPTRAAIEFTLSRAGVGPRKEG